MNRRKFLKTTSKGTAGFALGGFLARAYGRAEAIGPLAAAALPETDRILIIIRLEGGNDGLNTLVNYENDAYYHARPTLNIPKPDVLKLNETLGLHPKLTGFKELFDDRPKQVAAIKHRKQTAAAVKASLHQSTHQSPTNFGVFGTAKIKVQHVFMSVGSDADRNDRQLVFTQTNPVEHQDYPVFFR